MPRASGALELDDAVRFHSLSRRPRRGVGVVGPGLMGLGIAQAFAASGVERHAVRAGRGGGSARAGERLRGRYGAAGCARSARRRRRAPRSFARVEAADGDACARGLRNRHRKRARGSRRRRRASCAGSKPRRRARRLIASNTSGLAISGLAQALRRPGRAFSACISFRPPNACLWSRSSRAADHRGRSRPRPRSRFVRDDRQTAGSRARRPRLLRHPRLRRLSRRSGRDGRPKASRRN